MALKQKIHFLQQKQVRLIYTQCSVTGMELPYRAANSHTLLCSVSQKLCSYKDLFDHVQEF